jgi:hypothetical protein
VFNKEGFVTIAADKYGVTDFISRDEVIKQGVEIMVLNQLPFFRKFLVLSVFKQWKQTMNRNVYLKNRERLTKNFIFAKPIFGQKFLSLTESQNSLRFLKFVESKPYCQYGKHQSSTIEDRCKECV